MVQPSPLVRSPECVSFSEPPQQPPDTPMTPDSPNSDVHSITLPAALHIADRQREGIYGKIKRVFDCAIL